MLFANWLYIFNISGRSINPSGGQSSLYSDYTSLYQDESGSSFWNAIVHIYLISLGEFSTDDYGNRGSLQKTVIWILFLSATFFIQITFMNMLIAIMSNTYSETMAKKQ